MCFIVIKMKFQPWFSRQINQSLLDPFSRPILLYLLFSRYLLERDFPGMRIGPEPTTDNFHVIEHAEEDGKIPGDSMGKRV